MPFYYDVKKTPGTPGTAVTSNGSGNTLSTHFRAATVANQKSSRIMGLYGSARFGTAGGGSLYVVRPGAAGSGGTANTPAKRNPDNPAADTTWFDDATTITPGTSPIQQLSVGVAQTGGQGGWVALEVDHGLLMKPNAGANGTLEVASKFNAAAVTFDALIEFQEN
jgi:hypothetical protein